MVLYRNALWVLATSLLLATCFTTNSVAQNKSKTGEKKSSATSKSSSVKSSSVKFSKEQLEKWVSQLSEGNFRERRSASNNLIKSGKQAIPALQKGAQKDDAELGARCVDILKKMYKGKDKTLKSAAKKALSELENSPDRLVAQRAQNATKKPEQIPQNQFGNFRIIANGNAINVFQIANANGNGNWSKTISENGKKTVIEKTNGKITFKVTVKVNGKNTTKTYKAKNETELKKKHPKLFKLYQKHNQAQNLANFAGLRNLKLNGRNIVIGAPAGGIWQMRQQIVNGKRTTTVNENGKKIVIEDQNGQNIVVKVTETIKGKVQTKTYKAKNLKELKKKHSDIAKLYEKHTAQNRVNAVFGRAIQLPGRNKQLNKQLQNLKNLRIPIQIQGGGGVFLPAIPGQNNNQKNDKKIAQVEKKINKALKDLDDIVKSNKIDTKKLKKLNSQIQKLKRELKDLKK